MDWDWTDEGRSGSAEPGGGEPRSPAAPDSAPSPGRPPGAPDFGPAPAHSGSSEERAAARAGRRRQLRRRRLVALGVLVAVVVLVVVLIAVIARGCGRTPKTASLTTPSPAPTALRTPSAARPLHMAAYGESVGGGALLGLKLLTEGRRDIVLHRFVKVASGLTRPDYFDWPAYLRQDFDRRAKPFEAVMLMLGANDGQDATAGGRTLVFGSGSWKKWYAARVGEVMDLYLKRGVKRVYWVGMPRMGIGWFNRRMALLNGIYKAEAAKRAPRVEYIDAWTIVDAPQTTYQAGLRQYDGVHLQVAGGLKVARAVLEAVARDWHLAAFPQQ